MPRKRSTPSTNGPAPLPADVEQVLQEIVTLGQQPVPSHTGRLSQADLLIGRLVEIAALACPEEAREWYGALPPEVVAAGVFPRPVSYKDHPHPEPAKGILLNFMNRLQDALRGKPGTLACEIMVREREVTERMEPAWEARWRGLDQMRKARRELCGTDNREQQARNAYSRISQESPDLSKSAKVRRVVRETGIPERTVYRYLKPAK